MSEARLSQEEVEALVRQASEKEPSQEADVEKTAAEKEKPAEEKSAKEHGPPSHQIPSGEDKETRQIEFEEITAHEVTGPLSDIENMHHIKLNLEIVLGEANLTVKELLGMKKDSVITINKMAGENALLYANGKLLSEGEIVILNDRFSFRIGSLEDKEQVLRPDAASEKEDKDSS